jgi:hypothetical protein
MMGNIHTRAGYLRQDRQARCPRPGHSPLPGQTPLCLDPTD